MCRYVRPASSAARDFRPNNHCRSKGTWYFSTVIKHETIAFVYIN